jgi:hypothetical protein
MAATVKTDTYTSASYNWDSASAGQPNKDVVDELKAWVTTINGNASQTTKQVVVLRDEASSTTTNYRGWVVELPQTGTDTLYTSFHTNNATNARFYTGTGFTDDTSNGGYGTVTSTIETDTGIGWQTTAGVDVHFGIAYGTVDGEEFFFVGWDLGTDSAYSDMWGIFKTTEGYWAAVGWDGGSAVKGASYGGVSTEDYIHLNSGAGVNTVHAPGSPIFWDTAQSSTTDVFAVMAKSADLYNNQLGRAFGNYNSFADGSILISLAYNNRISFRTSVS